MIAVETAAQLRTAGLTWKPAAGDRFVIPDRDMDEAVFVLSDMTVEVHDLPEGRVIGFNGTTEWALDDVELDEALWLPREDQLRELLGGTFRALRRDGAEWVVETELLGETAAARADDPAEAYAAALLRLLAATRD